MDKSDHATEPDKLFVFGYQMALRDDVGRGKDVDTRCDKNMVESSPFDSNGVGLQCVLMSVAFKCIPTLLSGFNLRNTFRFRGQVLLNGLRSSHAYEYLSRRALISVHLTVLNTDVACDHCLCVRWKLETLHCLFEVIKNIIMCAA